jgi:hypothetical protein
VVIVVIAVARKSPSIPEATIATKAVIARGDFQDAQHATGKAASYTFDVIGLAAKTMGLTCEVISNPQAASTSFHSSLAQPTRSVMPL